VLKFALVGRRRIAVRRSELLGQHQIDGCVLSAVCDCSPSAEVGLTGVLKKEPRTSPSNSVTGMLFKEFTKLDSKFVSRE
jgi:hypothetical protein